MKADMKNYNKVNTETKIVTPLNKKNFSKEKSKNIKKVSAIIISKNIDTNQMDKNLNINNVSNTIKMCKKSLNNLESPNKCSIDLCTNDKKNETCREVELVLTSVDVISKEIINNKKNNSNNIINNKTKGNYNDLKISNEITISTSYPIRRSQRLINKNKLLINDKVPRLDKIFNRNSSEKRLKNNLMFQNETTLDVKNDNKINPLNVTKETIEIQNNDKNDKNNQNNTDKKVFECVTPKKFPPLINRAPTKYNEKYNAIRLRMAERKWVGIKLDFGKNESYLTIDEQLDELDRQVFERKQIKNYQKENIF